MTDDPSLVAAEYVLGTLDAGERSTFAERLRGDPQAREAVAAWERRLAGLADRIEPVAPPPRVWDDIERAVQLPVARMHTFKVIDGGGRGGAPAALVASRNRWRAGALMSGLVAAALIAYIGSQRTTGAGAGDQTYVAAVNRGGDKPALLVSVDLATRSVRVRPVATETPAGRSLELWYVADGEPPRSMGVVDQAKTLLMPRGADAAARSSAAAFAVSVEPPGGSRTGGPTGPVVYSGQLVQE